MVCQKKSIDDFTQKKDEGLLNPFWRVWNTDMDGDAKGSFPGCNDDFSRRQILDQFFVSPLKFKNVTDCGVLDHLFGESFDTINKKKEVTSTKGRGKLHWPVYIKYKVGEYYV